MSLFSTKSVSHNEMPSTLYRLDPIVSDWGTSGKGEK